MNYILARSIYLLARFLSVWRAIFWLGPARSGIFLARFGSVRIFWNSILARTGSVRIFRAEILARTGPEKNWLNPRLLLLFSFFGNNVKISILKVLEIWIFHRLSENYPKLLLDWRTVEFHIIYLIFFELLYQFEEVNRNQFLKHELLRSVI